LGVFFEVAPSIFGERCDMPPGRDVRYALYFRWGTLEFKLTGRKQILVAAIAASTALGIKLLWPFLHLGMPP
jgi:hypothetical protein